MKDFYEKERKIKRTTSMRMLILSYTIQLVIPNVCTKFQNPACSKWIVPEISVKKNFIWEKKEWTNKGNDKHENAESLLHYTSSHTQCVYQISNSYMQQLLRNLWHIFPMYYTGMRDGKKEKGKKKAKEILASWFSFTHYTSILCKCIQNLKTLCLLPAEKSVTKKLYWRKRKMDK